MNRVHLEMPTVSAIAGIGIFDIILDDQWGLGSNIPSALIYDATGNQWGILWTESVRREMFGKGWIYRGWRGSMMVHKFQDAVKKVAGDRKRNRRVSVWNTKGGEYMANLDVSKFFWRIRRSRTRRPWKLVLMACPCGHCRHIRRRRIGGCASST